MKNKCIEGHSLFLQKLKNERTNKVGERGTISKQIGSSTFSISVGLGMKKKKKD